MRIFLRVSVLVLLMSLSATPLLLADDGVTVATESGPVRGKQSTDGKVRIFLGVPYAAPPVGPLRWKPPQPPAAWKEVREATAFASRCTQIDLFKGVVYRDPGMSEDCLYLNVWAPAAAKDSAPLPVMVWIHGGGFHSGGPSEPRNDGEPFARRGVIVVSMAYRLGILGFLATHELAAESPQHAAGNYGLMDQSAAIRWVKNNVAAFGGDPAKITLIGQSAGSFSVTFHTASPLTRDIPAGAIGESGGALGSKSGVTVSDLAASIAEDEKLVKNNVHAEGLAALRAIPADELIKKVAPHTFGAAPLFMPNVDGYFLAEPVAATFAASKNSKVPLLAGWNKDELSVARVLAPKVNLQGLNGLAFQKFKFHAGDFLKVYRATNNEEAAAAAADFSDDEWVGYATWSWLDSQVRGSVAQVYRYSFDLGIPGAIDHPASWGAYHSDEIDYVFGTLDSRKGYSWRPEDYKLSELMQSYWTNFVKTGNPNAQGLPNWPAYAAGSSWQVMHLDAAASPRPDEHRERYLFLQKSWEK